MALPDLIFAQASPRSITGKSMFESRRPISAFESFALVSHPVVTSAAAARLRDAGFEILQTTPLTINIAGTPDQFEKAFGRRIVERELALPSGDTATHLSAADTQLLGALPTEGTPLSGLIEGVALEVPRSFLQVSPAPPETGYFHLEVPTDVARGCNATALHNLGIDGKGVRVAMVDSGWFRHPYFTSQRSNVAPVVLGPAATEPDHDESGHGTGESANIFAIAPGCELLPVKANFVNTTGAFNTAVALNPHIVTCSWGSHSPFALTAADMVLSASVAAAVASGITVIFSAGNGHAGFPGQHPDVLSAGGVFLDENGSMQASNYSSGFDSTIFQGRRVPDVCGLVGMRPKAIYIMLPVEPNDSIDAGNAGNVFPDGDETTAEDGWAGFSGTSAAAPQLAGAAALIKQIVPDIPPAMLKTVLMNTARDVFDGRCSPVPGLHEGLPAEPGPDSATGSGLVDVFNAVVVAYTGMVLGFW